MENIVEYQKCSCGAVTLYTESGNTIVCKRSRLKKYGIDIDLRTIKRISKYEWGNCDHCVNKFGIDLCECGSGKEVGKCSCGSRKNSNENYKNIHLFFKY